MKLFRGTVTMVENIQRAGLRDWDCTRLWILRSCVWILSTSMNSWDFVKIKIWAQSQGDTLRYIMTLQPEKKTCVTVTLWTECIWSYSPHIAQKFTHIHLVNIFCINKQFPNCVGVNMHNWVESVTSRFGFLAKLVSGTPKNWFRNSHFCTSAF